ATGGGWDFTLEFPPAPSVESCLFSGATVPELHPQGILQCGRPEGGNARDWVSIEPPDWMPEILEWPVTWAVNFWHHPVEELKKRTRQRDELQAWVAGLTRRVTDYFVPLSPGPGRNLDLTWAVWPGRLARFWITLQPGRARPELVEGLRQQLLQLPVPDV